MKKTKTVDHKTVKQMLAACEAAEITIYGTDFLCRALAILHCYGGGPGGEHFRAPVGYAVCKKAEKMLEEAVMKKDWPLIEKLRAYVKQLQADAAPWLPRTLDKLNIPAKEIEFSECIQPKPPKRS